MSSEFGFSVYFTDDYTIQDNRLMKLSHVFMVALNFRGMKTQSLSKELRLCQGVFFYRSVTVHSILDFKQFHEILDNFYQTTGMYVYQNLRSNRRIHGSGDKCPGLPNLYTDTDCVWVGMQQVPSPFHPKNHPGRVCVVMVQGDARVHVFTWTHDSRIPR